MPFGGIIRIIHISPHRNPAEPGGEIEELEQFEIDIGRNRKKGTIPGRGGNVLNTAIHPHRAGKSRGGAGSPRLLLARWISYDMKSKISTMKYRPFLSRGCFSIFAAS